MHQVRGLWHLAPSAENGKSATPLYNVQVGEVLRYDSDANVASIGPRYEFIGTRNAQTPM
mgnify:CR=1